MAQVDYFLKINGVEGESQADGHKNEIQVESYWWNEVQTGTMAFGGGGGVGKVQINDFHFTMRNNKASPKLFLACASGEHFADALFTARRAGKTQQEYLKFKFTDILVTSFQAGGSTAEIVPTENISFEFCKMEMEYYAQKPDGSLESSPVKVGWDCKKEKKI